MAAGKQVIFSTRRYRPDSVLHRIVVNIEFPIGSIDHQLRPAGNAVSQGFANGTLRQHFCIILAIGESKE